MANCINCGEELFETSRFCPHCGAPVLEVSSHSEGAKIKEYDGDTDSESSVEGLPDINTAELTPEEQAAVLEMAAEKVLEDIPFIKKLDEIPRETENTEKSDEAEAQAENIPAKEEIHKMAISEKEASMSDKPEEQIPPEKHEDKIIREKISRTETVNIPSEPAKKSKGGLIAVIAVIAVAAVGGAVFLMGQNNEPVVSVESTETVPEMTVETSAEAVTELSEEETNPDTEAEVSSEAVISEEITSEISEAETGSESSAEMSVSEASENTGISEISESSVSEAAGEGMHTAEELVNGIIIEPEHSAAMGNEISAEISLSAEGIDSSILTDGVLFLAEYTSQASAPENITPAAMVITIGDTSVNVSAASSSEGIVIFEYESMKAAAEAAGFTASDIDLVAVRSTGVPIDVFKITIFKD